jgi:YcaO-like protein with predicted kinase domain
MADPDNQQVADGMGCHPSRSVALLRALTEAVQVRLTVIAGSRDDLRRKDYEPRVDQRNPGLDWSWIDGRYPRRSFSQVPTWEAETFEKDVTWLLERLTSVGIAEVIVVDLTRPAFGIPVVRVIIPGMELAVIDPSKIALGQRARTVQAGRV